MTDSAERLDPCPFCGGQPSDTPTIEQIEYNSWVASINCNRCYISMTPKFTEPSEAGAIASAIAAWNRRPPAEAGALEGWKPIETAPKDRMMRLWVPEFDAWAAGEWKGAWSYAAEGWRLSAPMTLEGKQVMVTGAPVPTHWMPLASAPVVPGEKS